MDIQSLLGMLGPDSNSNTSQGKDRAETSNDDAESITALLQLAALRAQLGAGEGDSLAEKALALRGQDLLQVGTSLSLINTLTRTLFHTNPRPASPLLPLAGGNLRQGTHWSPARRDHCKGTCAYFYRW